jgi:hypothetical protein
MITEDLLERGLAAAADDYEVPAGAVDRLRAELNPAVPVSERRTARGIPRPTRRGWYAIAAGGAAALVVLPLALGGVGSDSGGTADRAAPAAGPVPQGAVSRERSGELDAVGSGRAAVDFGITTGKQPVDPADGVSDRVVKTGVLDLQVPKGKVTSTLDEVTKIATILRGYVESSRTSEGGFAPSGQVTLRVPVTAFEEAVSRARALGQQPGSKVLGLETSGEDVTDKYVDLQARIHVLRSTRETFLTLLAKATTIGETLAVQQRVTDVQTEIERLQGQLKVLSDRSAMSTLTVTIDQKVIAQTVKSHEKSGIHKAFDRSVDRFVNGVEAIVAGIGPVLLAILVIAALWFGGRLGYRVLRRRMV